MKEPAFWYQKDPYAREAAPVTRQLLWPFSKLYAYFTRRRLKNTIPYKSSLPVICVGNVTLGGTGKTPIVAALYDHLKSLGHSPVILSRGYGGHLKGPVLVDKTRHRVKDTGDEPLMLAQSRQVVIARDRPAGAKFIETLKASHILMDDGHQNPTLYKDISLIVVDKLAGFGNKHVFPSGPLREPIAESLARGAAIILTGRADSIPPEVTQADLPVFHSRLQSDGDIPAGALIAFAGIGRPEKFFQQLKSEGAEIIEDIPFPDHHKYTKSDFRLLERLKNERKAKLITTAKDAVKITDPLKADLHVFEVKAQIDGMDKLMNIILDDERP